MLKGTSCKPILFYFRAFLIIITSFLLLILTFSCDFRAKRYASIVQSNADRYGLEPCEIFAIIEVESGFNPIAKSEAGALGLMQIMPTTGKWIASELGLEYSDELLKDPEKNVRMGCFYLSYLYSKFNDSLFAYAAYNAGETVVFKWIEQNISSDDIPYAETRAYVRKVVKRKNYYKKKKIAGNH